MSVNIKRMKEQAEDPSLILTPRINEWLLNNGEKEYRDDVVDRMAEILSTPPRNRSGAFSASAGGTCQRAQVYGYLGVQPNETIMPQLQNLFNDGKWRHLRWQAMLLSAGLIETVEAPISLMDKMTKGSMDGRGFTGNFQVLNPKYRDAKFGLELKGMRCNVWEALNKSRTIDAKHQQQIARYFLGTDIEFFCYIAENKDTSEWVEIVVERNQFVLDKAEQELDTLNNYIQIEQLPPRLAPCQAQLDGKVHKTMKKGFDSTSPYAFKNCPFGKTKRDSMCLKLERWEDARD